MILIDGKKISEEILDSVRQKTIGRELCLAVVSTRNDPASALFVSMKKKIGKKINIKVEDFLMLNEDQDSVIEKIKQLSDRCDGVVVQLPLREDLDLDKILAYIPDEKNPDLLGVSAENNMFDKNIFPPVVSAVISIFSSLKIDFMNKTMALLGNGYLVGAPISRYLNKKGKSHFIVTKENEKDIEKLSNFDIVISGVGIPGILKKENIKENAILIDAGTSDLGGTIVGDINKNCYDISQAISPVPGGVGPITVAYLFYNLVKLTEK